jgi:hypothetical protein
VTPSGLRLAGINLAFAGPPPRIIHAALRELNGVNLNRLLRGSQIFSSGVMIEYVKLNNCR